MQGGTVPYPLDAHLHPGNVRHKKNQLIIAGIASYNDAEKGGDNMQLNKEDACTVNSSTSPTTPFSMRQWRERGVAGWRAVSFWAGTQEPTGYHQQRR